MNGTNNIRSQAQILSDSINWRLGLVATSVNTIGKILHRHTIDDSFSLTEGDIEGLALAVEAFGGYLTTLTVGVEDCAGNILGAIDELEVESS